MNSPLKRRRGFTLIELLTVIAIIGILAGFIAAGLPRALMAAKLSKLDNTFLQIRNILTEYLVAHGTFPPAYGYLDRDAVKFIKQEGGNIALASLADLQELQTGNPYNYDSPVRPVYTRPWMDFLENHNNRDLYDNFAIAYDSDRDQRISRLEFSPSGLLNNAASQLYDFDKGKWRYVYPHSQLDGEMQEQILLQEQRPMFYFPVNLRQFRKVSNDWHKKGQPSNPRPIYDTSNPNGLDVLASMNFPPPNYDSYVLISAGPSANTWRIIVDFTNSVLEEGNYSPAYYYHVLGMATYFMATRDAENNGEGDGELDFDYRARTRRGQGKDSNNKMPDAQGVPRLDTPGPVIFVGEH